MKRGKTIVRRKGNAKRIKVVAGKQQSKPRKRKQQTQ